jgi:dihydropteroate synthase
VPRELLARLWLRDRPAVMGVLNVTPDSFSDGGRFPTCEAAVGHALDMLAEGADVIDVGGESTRPGAVPVAEEVELERVVPVIGRLARLRPEALISVDTSKVGVAAAGLDAGARVINDVTAGRDPSMLELAADRGAALVLMHMRGDPRTMQHEVDYADVVAEVHGFLATRAAAAVAAGVEPAFVLLDPGIGFGKSVVGNLALLRALPDLAALGHPVVVGASRKSFIAHLCGAGPGARLPGSLASLVATTRVGHCLVRVHDVAETVQFLTVLAALEGAA